MAFREDVYRLLKKVPEGKVTTYKALAEALGTKAYRAVGTAMRNNKDTENIPCYKVVKSDGSVGFYSKRKSLKIKKLEADGIRVVDGKVADFDKRLWKK